MIRIKKESVLDQEVINHLKKFVQAYTINEFMKPLYQCLYKICNEFYKQAIERDQS